MASSVHCFSPYGENKIAIKNKIDNRTPTLCHLGPVTVMSRKLFQAVSVGSRVGWLRGKILLMLHENSIEKEAAGNNINGASLKWSQSCHFRGTA